MPKVIDETVIFSAALEEFVRHGYEGATTRRIAERAGVNEVTVYRKYGSKLGLFERAFTDLLAETPLNRIAYSGELERDLVGIVEAYVETNEAYGEIVPMLLIEQHRYPELRALFETPWKNLQGMMGVIRKYQEEGRIRDEPVMTTFSVLIGPILVEQLVRHAELDLPMPPLDAMRHVKGFLNGRRAFRSSR